MACQCEEGNPNDVYAVAVKTDTGVVVGHLQRKIGSLFSVSASEWYDQSKLAHGPVKFPVCLTSHFAMNIIMTDFQQPNVIIPQSAKISLCQNFWPYGNVLYAF